MINLSRKKTEIEAKHGIKMWKTAKPRKKAFPVYCNSDDFASV